MVTTALPNSNQGEKLSAKERAAIVKRMRQKVMDKKNMETIRSKMLNGNMKGAAYSDLKDILSNQNGNNGKGPKMPDLSSISKMNTSELRTMANLTGIPVDQLLELSEAAQIKDPEQLQKILEKHEKERQLTEQEKEQEGICKRACLVDEGFKEGKFKDGTEKERNLIFAFMDKLKTDKDKKQMPEAQKDKLRAWIILYYKLHGLGSKTPQLEEWKEYGIHPDEILTKAAYKMTLGKVLTDNDDNLSELSDLSDLSDPSDL